MPVSQIKEGDVDDLQIIPQERTQRTEEQIVGVPEHQIKEDVVEVTDSARASRALSTSRGACHGCVNAPDQGVWRRVQGDPAGAGLGTHREAD